MEGCFFFGFGGGALRAVLHGARQTFCFNGYQVFVTRRFRFAFQHISAFLYCWGFSVICFLLSFTVCFLGKESFF